MLSIALASVLVALFATAGAISIARNLSRRGAPKGEDAPGPIVAEHPAVGGFGMLFGVVITLFYVDADLAGAKALLAVGAVLAVVGAWLGRPSFASRHGSFLYELAAGTIAACAVLLLTPSLSIAWTPAETVFMVMLPLTPAAVSYLLRSSTESSDLPIGVVLIQLLCLLLLAGLGPQRELVTAFPADVQSIALPVIGALLGALLYICPMPWRRTAAISTGIATSLCLGLVVVWAAGRIGLGWFPAEHDCAAFMPWILAVPVFEWLRGYTVRFIGRPASASGTTAHGREPVPAHPAWSLYMFTALMGGIGITLWLSDAPAWSVWGLIPAWLVYCLAPLFLHPSDRRTASPIADA